MFYKFEDLEYKCEHIDHILSECKAIQTILAEFVKLK